MNFSMMQSLGAYTKNLEMQMKWQQKKTNDDFTADGSTKIKDPTAWQAEQIRQSQADGSAKLSSQIRTKLACGKKLTQEEMDYLQKTDPQTYQKAKSIEAEQKSYEKELERCKTKEDVERVRTNRVAASLSVVNSVKNNSAIPEGAKLGIIWQELQKNMAMEKTITNFVKSGRYAQLPTEAELREAQKQLEEAKEAESGMEDPMDNTEGKDSVEKGSDTGSVKEADKSDKIKEASSDKVKEASDKIKETEIQEAVQKSRDALQKRKMTFTEAESTPEALKVKHARAKAAYKKNQVEIPE